MGGGAGAVSLRAGGRLKPGLGLQLAPRGYILICAPPPPTHLLRARLEVLRRALGVDEDARPLDHEVDVHGRPGKGRRVAARDDLDRLAVDREGVVGDDLAGGGVVVGGVGRVVSVAVEKARSRR